MISVEMTTGERPGVKFTAIDWPSLTTAYRTAMIPTPTTRSAQDRLRPRSTSRYRECPLSGQSSDLPEWSSVPSAI